MEIILAHDIGTHFLIGFLSFIFGLLVGAYLILKSDYEFKTKGE